METGPVKAEGDTEVDKHVRKDHYAAEGGGAGGAGGCFIFLHPSSSSPFPLFTSALNL